MSHDGSIFLGIPGGTSSFVSTTCVKATHSGDQLCDQLKKSEDQQSSMLLLRHCHIPRLDHLARSVERTLLSEAMSIQDFQSLKTFVHLLGETFVDDQVWKQACLPIRMGGFGLTPLSSIAGPAFVASWFHTISELPSRFPHLKVIMDKFTCDASSPVGHAFRSYLPTNKKISDYKGIRKLQHQLSISTFKEDFQHLVDAAPTARDEARFRSLQGKSAGAWLHALPTSYGFALNPCEFRLACRVRLGLPITISKWVESCNCNASLDNSGYHLLTCKTGEGPIWSHESIAGVWSECLRSLRIHHCREPRNRYTNSERRLTLSCLMLSRMLILILTSHWHTLGAQMFSQALLRQQGSQLIEEKPERWPSTNNTNCLEAQQSKSFHWLWNILDHGEKRQEKFCRNWQPFHQIKQEDLMLQNF